MGDHGVFGGSLSPLTELGDSSDFDCVCVQSKRQSTEPSLPEPARPKKRARTATVQPLDLSSLPERTSSPLKIGAHVSAAGGIENSIFNALKIGANAFAIFVKSQLKFESPPLAEESIQRFKERMKEHGYSPKHILPHGNYLVNLANPDPTKRERSYNCFLDDLKRCEVLGLELFNFHPGSSVGETTLENAMTLVARAINEAHKATTTIVILLETMAYSGNVLGSKLEHLASIISQVNDKNRVGVCVDTCHSFAAGYNLKAKEGWDAFCEEFDRKIGPQYFRAMHLNDSKTLFNSHQDRHENIGLGSLTLHAFHHILTSPRARDIPLILETPLPPLSNKEKDKMWTKEIALLYRMSTMTHGELSEEVDQLLEEVRQEQAAKSDMRGAVDRRAQRTKGGRKSRKKLDELVS